MTQPLDRLSERVLCGACGGELDGTGTCSNDCLAPWGEHDLEAFEDTIGCDMCGAHIDDPCDCFDPQKERRYR